MNILIPKHEHIEEIKYQIQVLKWFSNKLPYSNSESILGDVQKHHNSIKYVSTPYIPSTSNKLCQMMHKDERIIIVLDERSNKRYSVKLNPHRT